eukprot:Plantae.Rhodophyta-Purpureofilum_apyrenoidigerum.ctg15236.p1 GENE.Plantae.Rhodophyta-Purpureofilum_apyrenoidigerum.ctg15236~~Plantae.Rhodophyta-Purpureofilum_apyrenoidigerum.ctg15236.p1  ORF type:complete len:450 (+),score=84.79 Plantae.Rhodophyta-Purpureofilum_apyrenoidigerum.ctg15236:194-1543(+)
MKRPAFAGSALRRVEGGRSGRAAVCRVRMAGEDRQYDLLVYGATGVVGKRAAEYLVKHAPPELRWGIAARNEEKLHRVKEELCTDRPELKDRIGVVVGANETIDRVAKATKVVVTTAGPYDVFGEPLVKACVENKTDYLDITGELPFARRMIAKYSEQAESNGVAIIHSCGFDCVPADLGTFFAVEAAKKKFGTAVGNVVACFIPEASYGGLGSGTVMSLLGMIKKKEGWDPYSLQKDLPEAEKVTEAKPDLDRVIYLPEIERYGSCFVFGPGNARVVRRTATLLSTGKDYESTEIHGSKAYTENAFVYQEVLGLTSSLGAKAVNAFSAVTIAVLQIPGVLGLLKKIVSTFPFTPDDKMVGDGSFEYRFIARTDETKPRSLVVKVAGEDAGYTETSKICMECGMLAALERDSIPLGKVGGGFLTPTTAFGMRLVERLRKNNSVYEVVEE